MLLILPNNSGMRFKGAGHAIACMAVLCVRDLSTQAELLHSSHYQNDVRLESSLETESLGA